MPKTKPKTLLGGRVYIVHRSPTLQNSWVVGKLGAAGTGLEDDYLVDENKVCTCRAADFGNPCKHVQMVTKKLQGAAFTRDRAHRILDDYLDVIHKQFQTAKLRSLLRYKESLRVDKATALGTGFLEFDGVERVDMWGERQGLLILLQLFRDADTFQKTFNRIRYISSGMKIPKADSRGYIKGIGQTYGGQ